LEPPPPSHRSATVLRCLRRPESSPHGIGAHRTFLSPFSPLALAEELAEADPDGSLRRPQSHTFAGPRLAVPMP
jgi:hypothetical protein